MLMPVKELMSICRHHGAMVLVDGAMTPGQIQLDLENLGADFFIGTQLTINLVSLENRSRPTYTIWAVGLYKLATCMMYLAQSCDNRQMNFRPYTVGPTLHTTRLYAFRLRNIVSEGLNQDYCLRGATMRS